VASDTVYVGSTDAHLYAIDAEQGKLRWKYKVDGKIYSAAAIDEKHVYFNSVNGTLYAVQ
jgi:outer membrane protein assembly factor BamB